MTAVDASALITIERVAAEHNLPLDSRGLAQRLDLDDPLKHLRSQFHIPTRGQVSQHRAHDPTQSIDNESTLAPPDGSLSGDSSNHDDDFEPCVYLCGNSLGLQPVGTRQLLNEELDVWQESGVHGHFSHRFGRPWVSIDELVQQTSAEIVGAKHRSEVAILNTLTVNLHLLMISFYTPTPQRYKIIIEQHAFPSDHYAVESQLRMHGFDPKDALICVGPREGEFTLRDEDILSAIREHGQSVALVLFSGVQYYTGQLFDMESIARVAHEQGCRVGFDLAHAVGNVELKLHDWQVDFAAWCSYKYLNSGPGSIAGLFVHQRHHTTTDTSLPRLLGWWGNSGKTRFQMNTQHFDAIQGADVYRMSNPCVLAVVSLLASLRVFEQTSMDQLVAKSRLMTGYLEWLLQRAFPSNTISGDISAPFHIMTPSDPKRRGCQLSLLFNGPVKPVFEHLVQAGIVCDKREPNSLRLAPVPLYNSFEDCWRFVECLKQALKQ